MFLLIKNTPESLKSSLKLSNLIVCFVETCAHLLGIFAKTSVCLYCNPLHVQLIRSPRFCCVRTCTFMQIFVVQIYWLTFAKWLNKCCQFFGCQNLEKTTFLNFIELKSEERGFFGRNFLRKKANDKGHYAISLSAGAREVPTLLSPWSIVTVARLDDDSLSRPPALSLKHPRNRVKTG